MSLPSLRTTRNHLRAKSAFTLIELLIVITIIGILVATGVYSWQAAQVKARDSRRKTDVKAIQQALESYYQTNGEYPPAASLGWCTQISNPTYPSLLNALQPTYITKVPQDPTFLNTTSDYFYRKDALSRYRLYSTLENTKDPDYIANALGTDGLIGCAGGNASYHYKVQNP